MADVNVRSHTFRLISPAATEKLNIPNPCTVCYKDRTALGNRGHEEVGGPFTMADRELTIGNHEFLQAVRKYDRAVLRLALAITGDEDAVSTIYQEVFLTIRRSIASLPSERSLQVAVYRIAANLCLEHLGRARRMDGSLTPHERIVFELRHYHGVRLELIGEILETSEDTARSTMVRALAKMRNTMASNAQCGPRAQPQTPASAFVSLDAAAQ
jgi:DNA-directed RNA polymerase specialized sigma24 family protein